ncbi:MAG TPA: hypothetical protein VEI97_20560 [bacterium]|nr:hypothetical protein [bacterium]
MACRRIARDSLGAASYSGNAAGLAVDKDSDRLETNVDGNRRRIDARRLIAGGSTTTLTAKDSGATVQLDTATGTTVTLPASSGSGVRYRFVITTVPTSNNHIVKVANASDTFTGFALIAQDAADTVVMFTAGGTDDTITLNRTTTGGTAKGEWIEVEDVATNQWHIMAYLQGTGTEATPFSATV